MGCSGGECSEQQAESCGGGGGGRQEPPLLYSGAVTAEGSTDGSPDGGGCAVIPAPAARAPGQVWAGFAADAEARMCDHEAKSVANGAGARRPSQPLGRANVPSQSAFDSSQVRGGATLRKHICGEQLAPCHRAKDKHI